MVDETQPVGDEPVATEVAPVEEDERAAWQALSPEEQAAHQERWWRERQAAARDLVERGKRSYAAMQGWGAVETEEQWLAIQQQAAED